MEKVPEKIHRSIIELGYAINKLVTSLEPVEKKELDIETLE